MRAASPAGESVKDATPAHRGLVYIVFEDLPLDEFGNRVPGVTAEIAWAGAPQAVVKDTTFLSGTAGDRLAIINEDPADATLADLSITFSGKRT